MLYLDADMLLVVSPAPLFTLSHELALAQDTGYCHTRAYMNGGMFVATPSAHLFHTSLDYLNLDEQPVCISGHLLQTDQELFNCMCGYAGADRPRRPSVHCGFLPWYMNVESNYIASNCADAGVDKIQILHYTGADDNHKPWRWALRQHCGSADIAQLATRDKGVEWFAEPSRRQCFEGGNGLLTYWHCVALHVDTALARSESVGQDDRCVLIKL